ncbi:nucleotidyl transferase AbiEii/AbiGii toxin family protein [Asticcacaulis sp. BYS171W]|uniref:Nucleotidyl transferase AbiEii/AbiGii toxin family protein n=1 Tax=Asticcacaulis aquaticus TaxID=2984212 RepID=A0ABT5HUL9_9CAUL|nr:nucleotidyl transferase AbiEii/AbiGii toxin family protein [Asticcacaulis aquaticus]MDC7683770.1 nucleotidyl transferase AbiEii/AbiGii toxin family protein [Asticcacaulis aquaticus]
MVKAVSNIAASARSRLLNVVRRIEQPFDVVLTRYALERILYRLSVSPHRDRFVLKGGLLVTLWIDDTMRVTRDVDFLGFGAPDVNKLTAVFAEILAIPGDDGLEFDIAHLTASVIREETEYGGIRLKTNAVLDKARIPITIDIGFGDAIGSKPIELDYPSLLDMQPSSIRAYPPATVIAEKFQAIVALGLINGRMKDYYDLWALPQSLHISEEDLDKAIAATFERRATAIPAEAPPGLSEAMYTSEDANRRWKAYAASIEFDSPPFETIVTRIWKTVGPSCERLIAK